MTDADKQAAAIEACRALRDANGNVSQAARSLDIPRGTMQGRLRMADRLGVDADTESEEPIENRVRFQDKGKDAAELLVETTQIRTVDDALNFAEVDRDEWEVERFTVNSWEVGAKVGKGQERKIEKTTLWQVKVWLKRRIAKPLLNALDIIEQRITAFEPIELDYQRNENPVLLELCPFDAHFGKHAWGDEVGRDYDLKIAKRVWLNAISDLLNASSHHNVEQIVIPLGNDFFHIDNWNNTTSHGTVVDTDGRWTKIFVAGEEVWHETIEMCLPIAPVKIIWVPGNHDLTTSFYLARVLARMYRESSHVEVDTAPSPRKYLNWGRVLLGYTHGNEEPHAILPNLMAAECPREWAKARHREWHIGHWHKRKQVNYVSTDTHVGVPVRVLPSLCGTDSWHHQKGFINGTERAAEAYLWTEQSYLGHLSVDARER